MAKYKAQEVLEKFVTTFVYSSSPYATTTSVWLKKTYGEGPDVYTVTIGAGEKTFDNVIDKEDALSKTVEFFKHVFPRNFKDADWLIFDAGFSGVLKEDYWNKLSPFIWDAVVEEFREDIDQAWFFMECSQGVHTL
jgi:hypothetical protein